MAYIAWPPRGSAEAGAPGSYFYMPLGLPWLLHVLHFLEKEIAVGTWATSKESGGPFLVGVAALVRYLRCREPLLWADMWDPYLGQGSLLSLVPGGEIGCLIT